MMYPYAFLIIADACVIGAAKHVQDQQHVKPGHERLVNTWAITGLIAAAQVPWKGSQTQLITQDLFALLHATDHFVDGYPG